MKFYESSAFDVARAGSIEVTLDEPIYVGVEKTYPDANLKMVVQDCWATDTANSAASAFNYLFTHQGCGLDSTFRTITENDNSFNFQINTFIFIQMKRTVYLHCSLFVCKTGSSTTECQHGCQISRKRRGIAEDDSTLSRKRRDIKDINEGQVGFAVSPMISYTSKQTCKSMECPANSDCIDYFPAFCRCHEGFVMHEITGQCTQDTVFTIANFRLDLTYYDQYSDPNSMMFLGLAYRFERKMIAYYMTEKSIGITGLKVIKMTRGSVIFRVQAIRQPNVTEDEVVEKFQALHRSQPVEVYERVRVIPQTIIIHENGQQITTAGSKKQAQTDTSNWVIGAAIGGAVLLMLIIVLLIVLVKKRTTIVVAAPMKNEAFEMDA